MSGGVAVIAGGKALSLREIFALETQLDALAAVTRPGTAYRELRFMCDGQASAAIQIAATAGEKVL